MEKLVEVGARSDGKLGRVSVMAGGKLVGVGLRVNVDVLRDEQLLRLCLKFGAQALKWRRRFTGLLPEVQRRRLYEKKGFNSIFEFAYKLAGLSEKQVRGVLNLGNRFKDKLVLKGLLESGEVSVNKLARVVSIATPENEGELAEKVRILPRGALETLVRDHKMFVNGNDANGLRRGVSGERSGLGEPLFEGKSLHVQALFDEKSSSGQTLDFEVSDEVACELNHLNSLGHDVNKIILELLQKRKDEIALKKEELAQEAIEQREAKKAVLEPGVESETSRYISVKVLAVLREEYGSKCSIPSCCKPSRENHHSQRIALVGIHDPRYMAPMCKEHHQIAHMIDQKYVATSLRSRL